MELDTPIVPNEKPIYVKLFMGEQDGYDTETLTVNGRFPEHVYVHRICDTIVHSLRA